MTVTVDIQTVYGGNVPDAPLIQQWAESALQQVSEDCELSIRLVGETESADLNTTYRGKVGPTNVLSFPFDADIELTPMLLGDLVVCAPVVEREAKEQGKLNEHHWAHMVVHGCLHLLGYDHVDEADAVEMETLETKIMASLMIQDPYLEQGDKI
jgi:probable rRNA maturation factor